jgi:replicative DNA helicase
MSVQPYALPGQQAPFSQEAEEAVIGAVLINPENFLIINAFLQAEDFYIIRNQYLWEALERIAARSEPIDYLTVQEELRATDRLNDIGGPAYLTHLINAVPTSVHGEIYARIVERASVRRRLLIAADEVKGLALDEEMALEEVYANVQARVQKALRPQGTDGVSMLDAVLAHAQITEERYLNPNAILGLPSVISNLNPLLKGYERKRLYLGGGRPGMGKSSHIVTEVVHLGRAGYKVALFSLEMSLQEITGIMLSIESGVPIRNIETGNMSEQEYVAYTNALARAGRWQVYLEDVSGLTPENLLAKCLKYRAHGGLDMVFVDYIQLMSAGTRQGFDSRQQELGYISRKLKALAKLLDIPVFAAAQLSREVEKRADKRPQMSDLRESGDLENDADVVMLYYRDAYYTGLHSAVDGVEIGIAKNRGGETGMVTAGFRGAHKEMVNMARFSEIG